MGLIMKNRLSKNKAAKTILFAKLYLSQFQFLCAKESVLFSSLAYFKIAKVETDMDNSG